MPTLRIEIVNLIYSQIMDLVQAGKYANPEQFFEVAAFNQFSLEKHEKPQEQSSLIKKSDKELPIAFLDQKDPKDVLSNGGHRRKRVAMKSIKRTNNINIEEVERFLAIMRLSQNNVQLPALIEGAPQPEEQRIWGQVNRFFPLKLIARYLLKIHEGENEWKEVDRLVVNLNPFVATYGTYLESKDNSIGRVKDATFSAGLSKVGNPSSEDRFQSQYIARITRGGVIYPGAICQYALATFQADRLALTTQGAKFALLNNPLIDGGEQQPASLSIDEKQFLIAHVKNYVPAERNDMAKVLTAISEGATSPEKLFEAISKNTPDQWSIQMKKTHVSGLVARLNDLGLIEKQRTGKNVAYRLGKMVGGDMDNIF